VTSDSTLWSPFVHGLFFRKCHHRDLLVFKNSWAYGYGTMITDSGSS
jgi:hypothetical protein